MPNLGSSLRDPVFNSIPFVYLAKPIVDKSVTTLDVHSVETTEEEEDEVSIGWTKRISDYLTNETLPMTEVRQGY